MVTVLKGYGGASLCTSAKCAAAAAQDYDKTPIGFGIVVFCIAKAPCTCAATCCMPRSSPLHVHRYCC